MHFPNFSSAAVLLLHITSCLAQAPVAAPIGCCNVNNENTIIRSTGYNTPCCQYIGRVGQNRCTALDRSLWPKFTSCCTDNARLMENPEVTVAVMEDGADRMYNPQVSTPAAYSTLLGREKYDWCITSVEQPTAGGKTYSMPNENSWEIHLHQTLDVAKMSPKDPKFMPNTAKEKVHGNSGPIHTSFNDYYAPIEEDFVKACYEVGDCENTLTDAWSGDHLGFYSSLATVDRSHDVLTEALATKIILDGNTVCFTSVGKFNAIGKVGATKEVICSAGTTQTPQILELSGIGDPAVLEKVGVKCLVENKRVGSNFQDHALGGMMWDLKEGIDGFDSLHEEEFAKFHQEIYGKSGKGMYSSPSMLVGFVSYASLVSKEELEQTIKEVREHSLAVTDFEKAQEEIPPLPISRPSVFPPPSTSPLAQTRQNCLQNLLRAKTCLELFIYLEHPLSRGTVHIQSSNPTEAPRIDPGYFRHPVDAKIMAAGTRWLDQIANRPILASQLGQRLLPAEGKSLETEERLNYRKWWTII
ncbi:alcohol oxidase [Venturia nashicola]|uniref:Alcohol oxidase n=1 Tax=Venturia nashicola TaxID=86259 RepID=A0A4Z1P2W7_9PEZI|nr:alcohol oxidase [Venturia nashicola]